MTFLGEAATEIKEKAGSDKYNVKLIISIIPTAEDATEDEDKKKKFLKLKINFKKIN